VYDTVRMNNKKNKLKIFIFLAIFAFMIAIGFYFLYSKKNAVNFSLEQPNVYTDALKITAGSVELLIKPLDAVAATPETDGAETVYKDTYAKTDIRQRIDNYLIKEDIVLKEAGHPAEFRFAISADGLVAQAEANGDLGFYSIENKTREMNEPHPLDRIFTIPAAFLIDAKGIKSSVRDVSMAYVDGVLTFKPDSAWLAAHPYPIVLDPSVEISILNLYSHPIEGDDWIVSFTTSGKADLLISPNDAVTIADDEFVSLWCGNKQIQPQILAGDGIFFKDWECLEISKVIHNTKTAGDHTLKFQFGGEIAYAYNHFTGDRRYAWGENTGWINASSTHETLTVTDAGITGYAWGENIGWLKFDYDGVAGATNTTADDWGVVNDGNGNLAGYAWGENIGWLNFDSAHSQVVINRDSGDFGGYAWGENIGWVNFQHTLSNYVVRNLDTPAVVTYPAGAIGSQSVMARGQAWRRGADITERGFKYGLSETDTWTKSESGNFKSGDFELLLENLTPGTAYYVRAYATNSEGTVYGAYVLFSAESTHKGSPIIFKRGTILKEQIILK